MKVVILAGGLGVRFSEETEFKPKPMIEIGEKPILWHIMKTYAHFGFKEFVICLGYKGYYIKEWFTNYCIHNNDITCNLGSNSVLFHSNHDEDWTVSMIDTGPKTMTGGRIKRIKDYVGNDTFMVTYGDGVGNINIKNLLEFHRAHGKLATLTATIPEGRFGTLGLSGTQVDKFSEKTDTDRRINAGYMILEPEVFDYIDGDATTFEKEPLEKLAKDGQLQAFYHDGFWKPMDRQNDKNDLEKLWNEGVAPWKVWDPSGEAQPAKNNPNNLKVMESGSKKRGNNEK